MGKLLLSAPVGVEAPIGVVKDLSSHSPGSALRPLHGLQGLRGIAALLVVLTHAAEELSNRGLVQSELDFPFGNFGVDIFFVISGFIIVYSSVPLFRSNRASLGFILRRAARIIPLYWIVSTIYLFVLIAIGELPNLSWDYIARSYLLIPTPEPQDGAIFPFYFPGWTLQFEMMFYACFSVALIWRRPIAIVAVMAIMLTIMGIGAVAEGLPALNFYANTLVLEFLAGCLLAEVYLRGKRLAGTTCVGLGAFSAVAVLITSYSLGGWPTARGFVWGLPAAALVAAVVLGPPQPARPILTVLAKLGDVSFSLYMIHLVVIVGVFWAITRNIRHWHAVPPAIFFALAVGATLAAAFLCFYALERPITRRLQRTIERLAPRIR